MSQSFSRPSAAGAIEDFDRARYEHAPSGRVYAMERRGDEYIFRRYLRDADGAKIFEIELPVAWVLGSGHSSRVYLYATPSGELFQLPLAWYSRQGAWGMAPGFDNADHSGLSRRVRRECMFCHNAYPGVAPGADRYGAPQLFPQHLPQGIGCQRCHGPGADHVELAAGGGAGEWEIRAAIVNPGRLSAARRNDVCYGCHLQPSVSLMGARRFGRGDYSFRPGESLAGYEVKIDVDEAGRRRDERFEINHHPYRLEQSACFQRSAGALSCLTCHDPHRKVPVRDRAAHYREACQGCHADDACSRPEHGGLPAPATDDCVACHMPRRRTQDVVLATMTDHAIGRHADAGNLVAELEERDPILVGVDFYTPQSAPPGMLGEIYRAAIVSRAGGGVSVEAVDRLTGLLGGHILPEVEPYLDLAQGQLKQRRFEAALATLAIAAERAPELAIVSVWRGIAELSMGLGPRAIESFEVAVGQEPRAPEAHFNLGLALLAGDRLDEAVTALDRALELRPTLVAGWHYLGRVYLALERQAEARRALLRSLTLDPRRTAAYQDLVPLLLSLGEPGEALRYARLGQAQARRPEALAELVTELERQSASD
jgi:Tfp pilus assembly protein PilF